MTCQDRPYFQQGVHALEAALLVQPPSRPPGILGARIYNYQMPFFKTIGALGLCCSLAAAADLRTAVIWVAPGAASAEKKAAGMLSEEIAKRTQIRLEVTNAAPQAGRP